MVSLKECDGIISTVGGASLAVVATVFKLSGRSLKAGLRKLFGGGATSNQALQPVSPQRHEVIVKVETPQPPERIEEPKQPEPKLESRGPPGALLTVFLVHHRLDFVSRSNKDGHQIVERLREETRVKKSTSGALGRRRGRQDYDCGRNCPRDDRSLCNGVVWTSADGRPDFGSSTLLDEIATQMGEPEIRKLAAEPKKDAIRELIDPLIRPCSSSSTTLKPSRPMSKSYARSG